jgi:hypothetical protein
MGVRRFAVHVDEQRCASDRKSVSRWVSAHQVQTTRVSSAACLLPKRMEDVTTVKRTPPFDAPFKFTDAQLADFIVNKLQLTGDMNLSGVVFPVFRNNRRYGLNSPNMDARGCTFEDGTMLQVGGNFDMFGSKCLGDFDMQYGNAELKAQRVTCAGNASFSCNGARRVDFTESTADKEFWVRGLMYFTATRLAGLTLSIVPMIDVETTPRMMPQD